ncbi:response regulator transcription factor [Leucobacter albus]|uniref:Response regulator transcription factor n=1 Tax=Leucobacter albus TaxID=272210 RepID=A0ABW3TR92_9MICO
MTDALDGHVNRASNYLSELANLGKIEAPSVDTAWASATLATALIAQEHGDVVAVDRATRRLAPMRGRYEPWPLTALAHSAAIRQTRGAAAALHDLRSSLSQRNGTRRLFQPWHDVLLSFEASLNTAIGNLARAETLLAQVAFDRAAQRIERARLALFASDDVEALLLAEGVHDSGSTKRQRLDQRLLVAAAAWACGRPRAAFEALSSARALSERYGVRSAIFGLPHDLVLRLAEAAREAEHIDVVAWVEAVPDAARAWRYEPLTEMELRTLTAIRHHGNANAVAQELFVTVGTVKKHLAAVYRKLRVRDRQAAIIRATEMGLLARTLPPG